VTAGVRCLVPSAHGRARGGATDDREGRPWVGAPGYRYGPGGLPADGGALGHDRGAGLGDGEAALEVVLEVDPDLCAVGDTHVLVDDRPVDHGVASDVDVVEDHRVAHRGPGVDLRTGGDHRPHDLTAGDDDTRRDE